jgi:hypothetical protein
VQFANKNRDLQNIIEALRIEGRLRQKAMETPERDDLRGHEHDSSLPKTRLVERF